MPPSCWTRPASGISTGGTVSFPIAPCRAKILATAEFITPVLNDLLRIDGDPDSGKLVAHLHLVNLV